MRLRRDLTLAGILLCLAGLAALRWEMVRLRRQEADRAAVQHQLDGLAAEGQSLRDRAAALRRDQDSLRRQFADILAAARKSGPDPAAAAADLKRESARSRARMGLQYAPLYRALHLTGAQAAQLNTFLADFMARRADIVASAEAQGLTRADPAINAMVQKESAELKSEVTNLLGADGYKQWQQYRNTIPIRNVEQTLAAVLYYTPTPLTDAQQSQLTPLLTQLVAAVPGAHSPAAVDLIDPEVLQAQASTVLSAPQVAALETKMEQNRAGTQMGELIAAWQKQHPASPASSP
jgi:hypothetical protein